MIKDRIGRQEVLLPIYHIYLAIDKQNNLTIWISEKTNAPKKISPVETISSVKNSSILEIPQVFFGQVVVAMIISIISVIGGLAEWT